MGVKNRTVLVTGASAGIGFETAVHLCELGANVIAAARRTKRLEELADRCRDAAGTLEIVTLDVRDLPAVQEFFASEMAVDISILINNAGLAAGLDTIEEANVSDWQAMIDTNISGLLYVTKTAIPILKKQTNAHIINIGSIAGRNVYPKGSVYCATKHAVRALNEAMRIELLNSHIRVSSIDPGMVDTEFSRVRFKNDEQKATKVYQGLKPLSAKDIAETIAFVLQRPKHVNIQELLIMPTAQANAFFIERD